MRSAKLAFGLPTSQKLFHNLRGLENLPIALVQMNGALFMIQVAKRTIAWWTFAHSECKTPKRKGTLTSFWQRSVSERLNILPLGCFIVKFEKQRQFHSNGIKLFTVLILLKIWWPLLGLAEKKDDINTWHFGACSICHVPMGAYLAESTAYLILLSIRIGRCSSNWSFLQGLGWKFNMYLTIARFEQDLLTMESCKHHVLPFHAGSKDYIL